MTNEGEVRIGARVTRGESAKPRVGTLFTQAGVFDLARAAFNSTTWMRDRHGCIAAIAEVPGVWVE